MTDLGRWARVSEILSAALDLPEAERISFLKDAVRREPELSTEVLAMFQELNAEGPFLEEPAIRTSPEHEPRASGASGAFGFGPYKVLGELGAGGMGIVYLAERDDGQFDRRVAIKRIAGLLPGSEALRRFDDEKQILARLDHPNIARLLDAGFDSLGVPYLVMEHVEGIPITTFCREHGLSVGARLPLFLKVCAAVQHAHRNLVIHRDIKPGNILVTPAGEPKLLDFGIAKLASEATEATPGAGGSATLTVNRALTLDFASPEQVRGEPVNTASDVYSLGVLLYLLLADERPYLCDAGSLAEAVHAVCELVPPLPSQVAPRDRSSTIAGDLDSIVRRAMEKNPADRYGSVADLAFDITAYRDHRPVRARRHRFGYVARKFVRRHLAAMAAVVILVAMIASGIAAVLWQARIAERERARAEQRFDEVRQLANYVIFDLQDELATLAGSTALRRDMVERSRQYLDSLSADSEGDAGLETELAGAYARLGDVLGRPNVPNLGDYRGAVASYRQAEAILRRIRSEHPENDEVLRRLARLLLDLSSTYAVVEPELAEAPLDESMEIWQELVRKDSSDEENLRGLASAHFHRFLRRDQKSSVDAGWHMERALALFQRLLEVDPSDVDRKRNVALCHKYLGGYLVERDPQAAYEHAVEAARLDLERLTAEPANSEAKLDYSFDLSTLGDHFMVRRRYEVALRHFRPALSLRRELWNADPANVQARGRLAYMLARVGQAETLAGRAELAAPLLHESIEHARAIPDEPAYASAILAESYLYLGEIARASGRDPCPWYARMSALVPRFEESFFDAGARRLRDRAIAYLDSCGG